MKHEEAKKFVSALKRKLKTNRNEDLAKILGKYPSEISNWKKKGVSHLSIANIISNLAQKKSLNGNVFLKSLQTKFQTKSLTTLAAELGVSYQYLNNLKKTTINSNKICTLIKKSRGHYSKYGLVPIVEMFPIEKTKSPKTFKVMGKTPRESAIQKKLIDSVGIYVFYDSLGKPIYVGRTSKKDLWFEINKAYNRERSKQTRFTVDHPKQNRKVRWETEANRRIINQSFLLHEVANYFSAYSVQKEIIELIEATLIRLMANSLLNGRMEKIKTQNK